MSLELFILIFLFALAVWVIGSPLYQRGTMASMKDSYNLRDLSLRKQEVIDSIKDLELDYKMSKVSEGDFKTLYDETLKEGASLLAQMDVPLKTKPKAKSDQDHPKSSSVKQQPKFCSQCGVELVANAHYCIQCGVKIS